MVYHEDEYHKVAGGGAGVLDPSHAFTHHVEGDEDVDPEHPDTIIMTPDGHIQEGDWNALSLAGFHVSGTVDLPVADAIPRCDGSTDATCLLVPGLSPHSAYSFRIAVRVGNGQSSTTFSDATPPIVTKSITRPGKLPSPPTASNPMPTTVQLSIPPPVDDGGSPPLGVLVYRGVADIGFYADPVVLPASADNMFRVGNLIPNTQYQFRVQWLNSKGPGPLSQPSNLIATPMKGKEKIVVTGASGGSAGTEGATVIKQLTPAEADLTAHSAAVALAWLNRLTERDLVSQPPRRRRPKSRSLDDEFPLTTLKDDINHAVLVDLNRVAIDTLLGVHATQVLPVVRFDSHLHHSMAGVERRAMEELAARESVGRVGSEQPCFGPVFYLDDGAEKVVVRCALLCLGLCHHCSCHSCDHSSPGP